MDLREQLQKTLGDTYTLERELAGGGMSRVFVAMEHTLGRPVVVKVLPTEMAGQVSLERFKREIRLAASLQQANIVPVLSAGDAHVYLTVPFVLGWSMMDALAYGAVVVGSDTEPVREMISPGENGFLVDFFDPEAIAEQTLEVLRAPATFEPVRRNAVRFIRCGVDTPDD